MQTRHACCPGPTARTGRQLAELGITRGRLRALLASGELVRVRRGVYAAGPLAPRARHLLSGGHPDHAYVEQVRAVLLSLGGSAAAGGRTAAVLWGFDLAVEPSQIEVTVARGRGHVALPGVVVRRCTVQDAELRRVADHQDLRLVSALATVVECALTRPRQEAVVIADSALRTGRITLEQLVAAVRRHGGRPGARRLRGVLNLVDPDSGSVLESLLRVLLARNGMHPRSQRVLRTVKGQPFARVDFFWSAAGLVLECDGHRWHDPEDARDRDRRRDNEVVRLGWRVLRVTWDEVVRDPEYVVQLVRDSLDAARAA